MGKIMSYVIGGIGVLLLLFGIIWDISIYFQNWDVLLTYSDRFTLYWKPTVMEIAGYIIIACVKEANE